MIAPASPDSSVFRFFLSFLTFLGSKIKRLTVAIFAACCFLFNFGSRLKFLLVRKLLWSNGRLFRPFSHFALLSIVFLIFLITGAFPGSIIIRSKEGGLELSLRSNREVLGASIDPETKISEERLREQAIIYEVQPGDTLSSIGQKFKISVETIQYANNLTDVNRLKVGQKLVVLPVSGLEYTVKSGDTIEKIAKKFDVSSQSIVDFNYLDEPFTLAVGQKLVLPNAKVPGPKPVVPRYTSSYAYGYKGQSSIKGTGQFVWPTNFRHISQYFSYWHPAIDIAKRSPIYAADGGRVVRAGWWPGGFGYAVQIDHGNGYTTIYAHLSSINVSEGQTVGRGQVIGQMGATGRAFGIHLHFVVRKDGRYVNPLKVL